MLKKLLQNKLATLVMLLLCSVSLTSCNYSVDQLSAYNNYPYDIGWIPAGSCTATYSQLQWNGFTDRTVDVVGFTKKDKQLIITFLDAVDPADRLKEIYVSNLQDCSDALFGSCFKNLYDDPDSPGTQSIVECLRVHNPQPTKPSPSTLVPATIPPQMPGTSSSSGGSANNPNIVVPPSTPQTYYWYNNQQYPDLYSAEQAARSYTPDGGKTYPGGVVNVVQPGSPQQDIQIPRWDAPKLEDTGGYATPLQPYFQAAINGIVKFFSSFDTAKKTAEDQQFASTFIYQMQRGEQMDSGVPTTDFSNPPVPLTSPSEFYYHIIGCGQDVWVNASELESWTQKLLQCRQGGYIEEMKRGTLADPANPRKVDVPEANLQQDAGWCSATEQDCTNPDLIDYSKWYWYSISLNKSYAYDQKQVAIDDLLTRVSSTDPRVYPGGGALLMTRILPKWPANDYEKPILILGWTLPACLPTGWNAKESYYSYKDVCFPSKMDMWKTVWMDWFLMDEKTEAQELQRGTVINTLKSPALYVRLGLIALGILLLVAIVRMISEYKKAKSLLESGGRPDKGVLAQQKFIRAARFVDFIDACKALLGYLMVIPVLAAIGGLFYLFVLDKTTGAYAFVGTSCVVLFILLYQSRTAWERYRQLRARRK